MAKEYLGDGCYVDSYVDHSGHSLVLTTSNGIEDTNRIVLEPEVYAKMLQFVERLKKAPA